MNCNCEMQEWDSMSEMNSFLEKKKTEKYAIVKIGFSNEGIHSYHTISLIENNIIVGICVNQLALTKENIIYNDTQKIIVIGIDSEIVIVRNDELTRSISTQSIFFQFLDVTKHSFIVVCELETFKVDYCGNILWRKFFDDIVTYFNIDGNVLRFELYDSSVVCCNINTGVIVHS